MSLPLIDQKPPRPGGSGNASGKNSKNASSNGFNDDTDGVNISCFGRSKKKSGDDAEDEPEPIKSKHQVYFPEIDSRVNVLKPEGIKLGRWPLDLKKVPRTQISDRME